MRKSTRGSWQQLTQSRAAREQAQRLAHERAGDGASRAYRAWQRAMSALVAATLFVGPITVTVEQGRAAAGVIAAGSHRLDDDAWRVIQDLASLRIRFAVQSAQAGAIADPAAPLSFQPKATQSTGAGGGVPVIDITAPNAAGISLNQYQSFNVDPAGLILNNSLQGGTTLTGGAVSANPNLNGRTASTIVNQVTSAGSAFVSVLNGPLEVFGAPATVIIANPNGIAVRGAGFTNTIGVTLTTGTPQFLTALGGSPTDFTNAQAVAYDVKGGHIQIEGNAGTNGPGSGIEGTVGTIDLIGETVGINAPLYAGTRINVIAGDQVVSPSATDATGTTYAVQRNGSANTAAAIGNATQGYAIDATSFGAMTAGQISVVGTAQGMGVRADGALAANAGNLTLSSNGDLTVANHAAQQDVTIASAGNATLSGTGLGVAGYTLSAGGDVTSTGTLQSGADMSVVAGGKASISALQANGNASATAGSTLTLGAAQTGGALTLATQGTAGGDVLLTGTVTTGGAFSAVAANNLTVDASVNAGAAIALTSGGATTIGSASQVTGQGVTLVAGLDAQIDGSLASGAALAVNAQGNLIVNGGVAATGAAALSAQQAVDISGVVLGEAAGTISAGSDLSGAGSIAFGTQGVLTAGHDVTLTGRLVGGQLQVTGSNNVALADVESTGSLTVTANGAAGAGDVTIGGNGSAIGAAIFTAARDLSINGAFAGADAVQLNAQRNVSIAGTLQSAGTSQTMTIAAGGALFSTGTLNASAALNATTGTTLTLSGATSVVGDTTLTAGGNLAVNGTLAGRGNGALTSSGQIDIVGSANFLKNAALTSTGDTNVEGSLQATNVDVTAGNNAALNNVQSTGTLSVTANGASGGGDIVLSGAVLSFGAASLSAARDVTVTAAGTFAGNDKLTTLAQRNIDVNGAVTSVSDVSMTAVTGSLSTAANLSTNGALTMAAAQTVALGAQQTGAAGNAVIAAGQTLSLGGALVALGGNLSSGGDIVGGGATAFTNAAFVSARNDINLTGVLEAGQLQVQAGDSATLANVESGSTLTISAFGLGNGGDITLNGASRTVGAAQLTAARDVDVAGTLSGGSAVTLSGGRDVAVTGGVQSAGDLTLSATTGSLTTSGALNVGGNFAASAGLNATLGGQTTVAGTTVLTSGQDMTLAGVLNGSGAGLLIAGRDLNGAGSTAFSQTATALAGRNVELGGLLQGAGVSITAGNDLTLADLESSNALTLRANGSAGGGTITLNGTSAAPGAITLTAAQDVNVVGKLGGGASTVVTASRDIDVSGTIESVGDTTLTATTGSLSATGGINSGGNLTATAGQNISLGASTSAVGDIDLTAGMNLTLGGTLVGANGNLAAGAAIDDSGFGTGTSAFSGAAALNAAGDVNLTGALQANAIAVTAAGNATLGSLTSTTTIALAANGTAAAAGLGGPGDIAVNGTIVSPGAFSLQAARDASLNGALACGASCSVNAGRDLDITAALTASTDLLLSAATGNLTTTAGLTVGGALNTTAGANVGFEGPITVTGDTDVSAGATLTVAGAVAGQGNGTFTADMDIGGAGALSFGKTASINAGHDTSLTGTLAAETIDVTAGNNAGLGDVQASKTLTVTATGNAGGGDATFGGNVAALDALNVAAARDISVAGATNGGAATTLAAGRNVTLTGAINSVGDLTVTAQSGALTASGVATQGALTASAGQSLTMTGAITANGDVSLTSGGAMSLGALSGQASDALAGTLNAGGDLNAASISFGNGSATLRSSGAIGVTGGLTAGAAVDATAANDAVFGSVQAGTTLSLQALGRNGAGDLRIGGANQAGGAVTLSAARDLTVSGLATAGGAFNATAGRNLTIGGALGANGDIALAATSGALTLTGDVSAVSNLTAVSGGALSVGAALVNGNTSLTSGGAMSIGGTLWGDGTGTFQAGGDMTGAGGLAFGQAINAAAGGRLSLSEGIDGAGDVNVTSAGDLVLGSLTAVGNATLRSTAGSMTLGSAQVGGVLNATAAQDLTAISGVSVGGPATLTATNGSLAVANLQGNDAATLTAGQGLALGGTNVLAGNLSLTGGNVTLTGTTTVSQAFTAVAQATLDTSGGQLYVTHDAALSGATIDSGAMIVGGSLTETATQAITASGQTLVAGGATFNVGGGAFTNTANNQVLAGGPLSIAAGSIVNAAGASLASTGTTTLTATSNMVNAGTINGQSTVINVGGNLSNAGGTILGTDAVAISTSTFRNGNGLIIAGNPLQAGATTGNLSLTVTGGTGGFDNTNGQLSAAQNAALSLVNMAWDPSAASGGGIYAGGQLSMTVGYLSVGGTWNVNAGGASITALNGASIAGAIQSTGAFSLASNGVIQNGGQIIGGSTVGLTGVVSNAVSALIHADGDLDLSGATVNRGTIEAQGNLNVSGSSFDNAGALTQVQGDVSMNLAGQLSNTGGKIIVGDNLSVQAASIVNDQTAPVGTTTTTTAINDPDLLWSSVVGTESWTYELPGAGDGNYYYGSAQATATLGNLLSPTGVWGTLQNVSYSGNVCSNLTCAGSPGSETPVAGSGNVTFDQLQVAFLPTGDSSQLTYVPFWFVEPGPVSGEDRTVTLTLPTVYETTTTQQLGSAGVISAGGNISLSANALSNQGGQIGAGGNVTLNVQSLSNGAVSPTSTLTTTDWVDPTQLAAFVNALAGASPTVQGLLAAQMSNTDGLPVFTLGSPTAASATSSVTWSTPTGVIAAGYDMNVSGGNLVNAGTLYAQHNVNISGATVTNQGGDTQQYASQAGCVAGTSNTACMHDGHVRGEDPNTSTFNYLQDNASIIAGNDLTISAGTINNTYGNLIAGHDIVVGGVGSTAGSTTAAQSLTNTSGEILAGNNVTLNVSGAVTNTLPPPVQVHQNYGSVEQYSGCMTAGGYKESYCEAYVDQQSGDSSVISAGNTLNIQAGSLTNVGSLITAGVNATINVAGPVVNQAQTLNAYWHSHWVQETGDFSADKRHDVWGCGSAAECTALYGSAYTDVGGAIDPPSPVGNIAATIQAPNLTVSSGGQIVNVGNVVGQTVSLTGTSLVNGITKSNTYTPVVGKPPQVISLAPAANGLNLSIPATLGGYTATQTTVGGQASGYVLNGTGTSVDAVTPQLLLANLPPNLQPSTALFYYNPQAEDAVLQTAALKQTGQATFVSGLSSDSQQQLSVTEQEKLVLYANAIQYAKANDIQLGQALTEQQLGELTQPMLWYVEQTVPEPGCTVTGTATCPTVTALMPQVYLPADSSALSADGNIVASDSLKLNFGSKDTGGSILNTGMISSSGSLTVDTGTLTNEQNQVDVGQIWTKVKGGYEETTGTVVQPGGFMTAAAGQMTLNVSQLNQIGGLLAEVNPDGSTNDAATQQLLALVLQQLGGNFTQTTVSDNLHTSFVAQGGFGVSQLLSMVAAMVLTAFGMPILAAMLESAINQLASGQGFSLGQMLEAGAVAMATQGLDSGLGLDDVSLSQVGDDMVNGVASAAEVLEGAGEVVGRSLVSAAVNTVAYGGSFGNTFENGMFANLAAVGAGAIGGLDQEGEFGSGLTRVLLDTAAHGALGCVASAAEGTGCASGAIGGAVSAALTPLTLGAMDPNHEPLTLGQTALATAISTLAGGSVAGLLGQNPLGGATAAANEVENNGTKHWVTAVICLLCGMSPPQSIDGQTDAGGGPMDPKDVLEQVKEDDVTPVPLNPFKQKPPGQ